MSSRPAEMRCRTCGYDLRGLTETRCPECGRAFDPSDPATFLTKPIDALGWLLLAVGGVFLVAWPPLFGRYMFDHLGHMAFVMFLLGPASMITGVGLGGTIAWQCVQIVRSGHPWVRRRWALIPAIIIGGGTFVFFVLGTLGALLFDLLF